MRLATLCALVLAVFAPSATAHWSAGGAGSGAGGVAVPPAGLQPAATASAQSVTVAWPQSTFLGAFLGGYSGGGYVVRRYASGGTVATEPGVGCDAPVAGAGAELQCTEAGVPFGAWEYTVKPVLATFTGDEGPRSAVVTVAPAAPVLATIVRVDPVGEHAIGDLRLSWDPVAGATGYDVYRRTDSGTYPQTPLNETPLSATTFTDPGSGLAAQTDYVYVVRALAGSPAVQSAASTEQSVTPTARPAPPATVSATAAVDARIDVSWASVPGATGYNVYRRTEAATFDHASPLGGATVSGTALADTTAVDGTTYVYVVRAVIAGADGPIESFSSTETTAVTADGTAPDAPTAVSITNGHVLLAARCNIAAGTRFVNNAGQAAVDVSATLAAAEPGASVVFSATTPGSAAVSGSAPAASPTTATLDLTSLNDGALTLTATSRDAAGNLSSATPLAAAVRKDAVFTPPLTANYSSGLLGIGAKLYGNAECGADIVAIKGSDQLTAIAGTGNTYEISVSGLLASSGWTVTATDPAGNTTGPVSDR